MLSARTVHLNIDGQYHPTRTPARGTRLRSENAYNQGAMTIQNGKGKPNIIRTPFQPKTAQPQRLLKELPGVTKTPIAFVTRPSRPLADKTPFVNRVLNIYNTPAPNQKSAKLTTKILETHGPSPENGSARASSTRKHSRAPTSATKNFRTPENQGNYWDISDEAITEPEIEQVHESIDDHDEIEYAPPNTLDLAYQPPFNFELPDYKVLGKEILRNVYCHPCEETLPPTYEFHIGDNDFVNWDTLSLASLDTDDEYSRPAKRAEAISTQFTLKPSRPTSRQAPTCTSSRPTTSASMRLPASTLTRGLASTSTAKPTTRLRSNTTVIPKPRTTSTTSTTRKNAVAISGVVTTKQPPKPNPKSSSTIPPTTSQFTTNRPATRPASRPATSVSTRPLTSTSSRTLTRLTSTSSSTIRPIVRSTPAVAVPRKLVVSRPPLTTARSSTAAIPSVRGAAMAAAGTLASRRVPGAGSTSSSGITMSKVSRLNAAVRAKNGVSVPGKTRIVKGSPVGSLELSEGNHLEDVAGKTERAGVGPE